MRKKSTRLLSAALAVCMTVTVLPMSAFASGVAELESSVSSQKTTAAQSEETEGVKIDEAHFPDSNFREFVTQKFDTNPKDGTLSKDELAKVTDLNCDKSYSGVTDDEKIKSLKGIEYFTSLKKLSCQRNLLTKLDVSNNSELEYLKCSENQLSALDVSNHPALEYLSSYHNPLTALNVSNCPALKTLSCEGDRLLSELDVSSCSALEKLYCDACHLSVLVLGNHPNLIYLNCSENQLASVNIGSNALKYSERYSNFHTYSNSYDIVVADNHYRLSKLPNFDASKVVDSQGGSFDPESNILTVDPNATEVTYTYNCGTYTNGESIKKEFKLNVTHHTHHYGDWLRDGTDHWKKCTDSDCPEREESVTETKAPHDFDEDGVCKVCGYQRETAVPDAPAGGSDTGNIQGALSAVVVGAAAGAIIYEAGTGIYRVINMPGIPMPSNRIELAELLWEHAGKPEPVSTALYSDIDEGDTDAQKAARWAVEQDLMKDDADNNKFNPYFPVSKLRVCLTWNAAKEKGLFDKTEE